MKKKVEEDVETKADGEEAKKKTEDSEKILKKYKTVGLSEDKKDDVDHKKIDEDLKEKEVKAERLIEELEKQKNEHKQILLEQKQVLEEMRQHVDEDKKARAALSGNDVQQQLPYVQPPEAAEHQQPRAAFGEQQLQPQVEVQNAHQHVPDLLIQQQQFVPQQDKVIQQQQQQQPHPQQANLPFVQPVKVESPQPQQPEQLHQVFDHQQPPQQNAFPQQPIHHQFVEHQQPVDNQNALGQQPPEQNLQHQQELPQVQQEEIVEEKQNLQDPPRNLDPDTLESKKELDHSNENHEKKEMKRDLEHVEQILDSQSQGRDLKYFKEDDKNCLNCAAKILPLQLSQIV